VLAGSSDKLNPPLKRLAWQRQKQEPKIRMSREAQLLVDRTRTRHDVLGRLSIDGSFSFRFKPGFPIWTDCRPVAASTEPPVPSASWSKRPARQRQSFWRPWGVCPPSFPGLVTLRPSRSETLLPDRHSLVIAFAPRGSRSRRVPREPLDAAENLPKERRRQVASASSSSGWRAARPPDALRILVRRAEAAHRARPAVREPVAHQPCSLRSPLQAGRGPTKSYGSDAAGLGLVT